ncbi:unnamed protein product [Danaus chrysippus]|uniref:(African queen) hypothetical protein n=1 Tax=Danaus chrysippus TaxID=151541 RepID=A0A8J2QLT2_9NEOP|nr:unnamed protein product [Danaus chrysippus]
MAFVYEVSDFASQSLLVISVLVSKRHCSKNVCAVSRGASGVGVGWALAVVRGSGGRLVCAHASPAAPCRPPTASQQLRLVLAEHP